MQIYAKTQYINLNILFISRAYIQEYIPYKYLEHF